MTLLTFTYYYLVWNFYILQNSLFKYAKIHAAARQSACSYALHTDGYFFPLIVSGSLCGPPLRRKYMLPVLDTMFVRKKHRGKDSGLIMLEDFVDSFTEEPLGLRYPLSSFMYTGKLFNFFF